MHVLLNSLPFTVNTITTIISWGHQVHVPGLTRSSSR
jgi:hypothetical protein